MTRRPTHTRFSTLILITLLILAPTLVTAQPLGRAALSVAEGSDAASGLLSMFWNLLSAVLANGSILEPDGARSSSTDNGSGLEPNGSNSGPGSASSTDNGSILEPNG